MSTILHLPQAQTAVLMWELVEEVNGKRALVANEIPTDLKKT